MALGSWMYDRSLLRVLGWTKHFHNSSFASQRCEIAADRPVCWRRVGGIGNGIDCDQLPMGISRLFVHLFAAPKYRTRSFLRMYIPFPRCVWNDWIFSLNFHSNRFRLHTVAGTDALKRHYGIEFQSIQCFRTVRNEQPRIHTIGKANSSVFVEWKLMKCINNINNFQSVYIHYPCIPRRADEIRCNFHFHLKWFIPINCSVIAVLSQLHRRFSWLTLDKI